MAQKATIFNGLMRKTEAFHTKLKTELGDKIREFAPTEQEIIFYCDEWLARVEEERRLGMCGDVYVDDDFVDENGEERQATEAEIIEKMIDFLLETDAIKEIYEQIHRKEQPTMVDSQGSHYFDEPYGSQIPVYLNDIFKLAGGDRYYGKNGEFLLWFLKEEVEEMIENTMREHLSSKLPKKE